MLRTCARWLVVVALTLSVGMHWVFLQSVAWVGMAVSYSQEAPLLQALEKTFDGKHPCKICRFVREGQQAERNSEYPPLEVKLDLLFVQSTLTLLPPILAPLTLESAPPGPCRWWGPPVPPPRSA